MQLNINNGVSMSLLSLLIITSIFNCVSFSKHKTTKGIIKTDTESFYSLKKEHSTTLQDCDEDDICSQVELRTMHSYATGYIIKSYQNFSILLTVDHFCEPQMSQNLLNKIPQTESITTLMRGNVEYGNAYIHTSDPHGDICLMFVFPSLGKPAKIAKKMPKKGEEVYTVSAPQGFSLQGVEPIITGIFSGCSPTDECIYTLDSAPGSSGSPIFNKRGEIIGIITAHINEATFISLSPHVDRINMIINEAQGN